MMLINYSLLVLAVVVSADVASSMVTENSEIAWQKFKLTHGKQYKTNRDESLRKSIFIENFNKIIEHNLLYDQGEVTFTLEVNRYADMTSAEITSTFYGHQKPNGNDDDIDIETFAPDESDIPEKFDWREKNAVTPVKDQGNCGSCWAFSVTGALEAQLFLRTGRLVSMSEQNLVDCSSSYGNAGCAGGDMALAYRYIHEAAIDSEEDYPYEAVNNTCRFVEAANVTSLKGYANIENGNEEHMKAAIATKGPLAVAIDARSFLFQFYGKGIFHDRHCFNGTEFDVNELNHAVLAVGYGTEDDGDYWLLKNSWGSMWGIDGYMKLARNQNNHCGIASESSFPITY